MNSLILKEDKLYTPITRYRKAECIVTNIGTTHIGTKEYYTKLQERIDSIRFGLFEGIKPKNTRFSEEKKEPELAINTLNQGYLRFAEYAGLTTQLRLTYPLNWISSDIDSEELKQFPNINRKTSEMRIGIRLLEAVYKEHSSEMQDIAKALIKESIKQDEIKQDDAFHREARDNRNEILFRIATPYLEKPTIGKIGIVYGASHTPGINNFLEKIGFKEEGIEWLEAANLETKLTYDEVMKIIMACVSPEKLQKIISE